MIMTAALVHARQIASGMVAPMTHVQLQRW